MKTKKSRGVAPSSPSRPRKSRFTLRGRRKKAGAIRGKLRVRSLPGAFLVLGAAVVVVGTALAVAGYWPYRLSRASVLRPAEGEGLSEARAPGWSFGAKGLLSTAGLVHSERMKLLGPVIMGVGLFILICANTVLYENRDRETQMLLAQMRSVMCSVSAAVPSADLKEAAVANSMARHYQWVSSLPAAHLNILCVQQLASSEPLLRTGPPAEPGDRGATLQTEALHHPESRRPPSPRSSRSDSRNSSPTGGGASPPDGPRLQLNVRLVSASSMSTLGLDEADAPAPQPRRCHSMSHRTNPYRAPAAAAAAGGGSQVCISIPGQVPEPAGEPTRQSWPRLDPAGGRRYLKLENKEDSVDRLLEQQCSHWDRSFGSGPFQ
ncbi:LOW QUALITY PROTEIN: transmembrane protein 200B-like [Salarias fasciatus]|uniref:LOW QUALITY PROTEIN: transmembrane protein 200B-like n=1 Tax=Salarias fasciatus TaxID=181472 RepID=UPI0011766FE1|nr:LOW QUALITY PROTEIN: transmembrane protein 200B-like [Salarias fasciatus]